MAAACAAEHAVVQDTCESLSRAHLGHCRAEATLQAALHDGPGGIQQVGLGLAQALQGTGVVGLRLQDS